MYHERDRQPTITNAPIVPMQLVTMSGKRDTSLYEFASSPSFQLAHRYLSCFDLEFSQQAIDAVRGMPTSIGQPNYIMKVRIARNGQELPPSPDMNGNSFEVIDGTD